MTDLPNADKFRSYPPVRVTVPDEAFEVYDQTGRVFYDLGALSRDLERNFVAIGLQVAILGTEADCSRVLGGLDAVGVVKALNDGLMARGFTHG